MLKPYKPDRNDYQEIADLVNVASQPFLAIETKEENRVLNTGRKTAKDIEETVKTREVLCVKREGVILAFSAFRLKNYKTVWISSLFVKSSNQREGIGKFLLDAIEEFARKNNAKAIVLEVRKKAEWAINFYRKYGYHILNGQDLKKDPFDQVIDKKPVPSRRILGKAL